MSKKKIPENTGIYFELIHTMPRAFILPNNRKIDFSLGIPFDALDLYKDGFPYLGLKEGAEVLFKNEKIEDLMNLIDKSQRKEDVIILGKASDSEKIKELVTKKINTFF